MDQQSARQRFGARQRLWALSCLALCRAPTWVARQRRLAVHFAFAVRYMAFSFLFYFI
jgi:hypothetical protein